MRNKSLSSMETLQIFEECLGVYILVPWQAIHTK